VHYEDEQVEIHKLVVGPLDNNVYVLRCRKSGDALLVDAANDPERLLECCKTFSVREVVETHGHWDHIQAVPQLRQAGYPVAVHAEDAALLPGYDLALSDNELIEIGSLRIMTIHTPGHTPGSLCLSIEGSPVLISGDTLFPGGPGSTGGDEKSFATIIDSIQRRLFACLSDETIVMPGHGRDTSIGAERPHLEEWIARGW
jgi:glyoxylase-like metal-dependent hydrolase (beta-lactamase superfamily II)